MIVEIGHFSLILALMVSLVQSVVPLWGAQTRNLGMMRLGNPAAQAQSLFVLVAFSALMVSYLDSDFSVANVWQNSHTAKPLLYKISGVWGNHEGSMLLWVLILTSFGAAVATFGGNLAADLKARVLSVHAMVGTAFLTFVLTTSNPFLRLDPAPLNGMGLNPLLQDPGLAFHPPFLYGGYVGFSMAFSFAVAALIGGRVDAAWARWVRPWTLAAWISLTIGVALGSYWAYYELGWGGFWFWDPVENASLMPWLVGTALLHSAIVVEKREALKAWTILLAIITFSLSLIGTFLVRSGVLTSVHAFAVDPTRGSFILVILLLVIGGSLTLFGWRAAQLKSGGLFAPISREGALIINNMLLTVAAGTVFIGTLYPLLAQTWGGKLSVGAPYFNMTFGPILMPLLLLVPFGPMLAWKRGDLRAAAQRLTFAAGAAFLITLLAYGFLRGGPVLAPLGLGLALWLILGAVSEVADRIRLFREPLSTVWLRARGLPRSSYGTMFAHAGLGFTLLGIVGVTAWQDENISSMSIGDVRQVSGFTVELENVGLIQGPNYQATRAIFNVTKGKRELSTLTSEKRVYPVKAMPTTEVGIRTTLAGDLYVALGEPNALAEVPTWTVRLYYKPLVSWIWLGALLMGAGGIVSLTDRRYRFGVARKTQQSATAEQAAE